MRIVIRILGGLVALILLLVIVAFFLPRQYRVERSMVINARPEKVLAQVSDLRAWKNWGAWQERDPGMALNYSNPSRGVGAWSEWKSKTEGDGKVVITEQLPQRLGYSLEFPEMGMKSAGLLELHPEGEGTRVNWSDAGDLGLNPINRWVGLFLDKMIGPDFDRGLSNLKKLVEKN